jgi:hypothetical protein
MHWSLERRIRRGRKWEEMQAKKELKRETRKKQSRRKLGAKEDVQKQAENGF